MAAPVIVSVDTVNYEIGNPSLLAYTLVATDGDGDTLSYFMQPDEDSDFFNLDQATGELTFKTAPTTERSYMVHMQANDGADGTAWSVEVFVVQAAASSSADSHATIDTAAVSQMLGGELSINSLAGVVNALATAADAADVANKAELQNAISALGADVLIAKSAADRLEAFEKGQIEEMLKQLVETDGFQALAQKAYITVNGQQRTLDSIVLAMIEAPKVENWKRLTDGSGVMNGVKATLTNGQAVDFVMTTEAVDASTNKHTFTVADFAGSGLAKSFYMVMKSKPMTFTGSFGGRLVSQNIGWFLDQQSNIVFDLNGVSPLAAAPVSVPDFNADGAAGNAPDVQPLGG